MPNSEEQIENTQSAETEKVEVDWKAEAEKWKALSRKNERLAEENLQKAQAYDEIHEKSKSELEKAIEGREKAEKAIKALQLENLRMKVAAETGVDQKFLHGDDEETMRGVAEQLIQWRGEAKPKAMSAETNSGKQGEAISDGDSVSFDTAMRMGE